ncbi:BTB-domain-containing protein [Gigaspora margarita]|uniref:BTB-domain-containing protein n=2 Tax=Gigaspora margarita TaxID=4874 RepID=A0A8H4A2Q2_GIGMA|nr:BTB-domain-containing protein [Gigaspora margarita]
MSNKTIQDWLESSKNLDVDTIINVGEEPNIKEFKAHSVILSAESPYLKLHYHLDGQGKKMESSLSISLIFLHIYIYTKTFSNKDEVSLLEIFIAADEIELYEISQHIKKSLLETKSAWKFPKDFITICEHDAFIDLYESALKFMRNEAHEYIMQGKFLKALELFKEILKNGKYNPDDQKYASNWNLSSNKCILKNLNEWSKSIG